MKLAAEDADSISMTEVYMAHTHCMIFVSRILLICAYQHSPEVCIQIPDGGANA